MRCVSWLIALVAGAMSVCAQTSLYPFPIDQDALTGAVDFGFLNHPLEAGDRIVLRDGHFARLGDGERVRFFGVNLAFGANFPEPQDAVRIAKRLRRLGVNLVRLHHMDSQPDSRPENAGSLLTTGPYPTLNPVAVSRLRGFLDALKAEGIYVNLNLHVGYQFRPSIDGVPSVPGAFPTQSKPLHLFWPRMVDLQTDYTRQIITALGLNDDPVLAMVEISNETSLVREWQANNLNQWLAGEYKTELERQWNVYLAARYPNTAALAEAWGPGSPGGPQLLVGDWKLEIHAPSQATYQISGDTVVVRVAQGGGPVILKLVGFSIQTGRSYLAEVEMRADLPDGVSRNVYWDVKQDVDPWRTLTSKNVGVTSQWQKFTMAVEPSFAMDRIGRFGLSVENVGAPVYVRNWKLSEAARRGLDPAESLEAGHIALVLDAESPVPQRMNDYLLFLAGRDRYYLDRMLRAVRDTAGDLVPVAGTQMGYGGLINLDSHAGLDYQDNHFYIDHYNFPNVAWDGRDWRIRDDSAIGGGLSSFISMAAAREAGKPYTVSEFNQPWPNRNAAEIDPALAVFGAFQDWDAIVHFAYSHGRNWDDGVPNGFNINGDWTKFVNIGQAAWLFRFGAIQAGREEFAAPVSAAIRLKATRERWNGSIASFLQSALGLNTDMAFLHRIGVMRDETGTLPAEAKAKTSGPLESDSGEFTFDRAGKLFLIHAAQAAGVIGFPGGAEVRSGAITVQLAESGRAFASVLLTSLDGNRIEESGRMLLSVPGYTLRTQPGSSPQRPQAFVNYGGAKDWWTLEPDVANKPSANLNGGSQPVWMERIQATLTVKTSASGVEVWALDGSGNRAARIDAARVEEGFRFVVQADGQFKSPWYEVLCTFDSQ